MSRGTQEPRSPAATYAFLRFWYLHELRRLRAATRIGGRDTAKERRENQKHLAALRAH